MEPYPANSNKVRKPKVEAEPPKKIEKVITGDVIRRKKPWTKRLAESFVGGDMKTAGSFVLLDVLLPAAKDTLADAVSQGIERMLWGEVRSTSRRTGQRLGAGYVSYNKYAASSSMTRRSEPAPLSRRARTVHDFDDIVLSTRVEAEEVIDRLFDIIATYESATVKDLYEMVGVSPEYTDDKWGWTDIRGSGVNRIKNGYLLDLPRPEPID
jgi:hypothetical protein